MTACGGVPGSIGEGVRLGAADDRHVAGRQGDGLAAVGHEPSQPGDDRHERQRCLVLHPHGPRRVHHGPQEEGVAGPWPVEESGQRIHGAHASRRRSHMESSDQAMDRLDLRGLTRRHAPRTTDPRRRPPDRLPGCHPGDGVSTAMRSLTIVTAVRAGLVAGVFFAFSTFVMRALEDLPPRDGLRGDAVGEPGRTVTADGPLLGTAAACIGLGIWSLVDADEPGVWYRVAGCAVYLVGIVVTIAYPSPATKPWPSSMPTVERRSAVGPPTPARGRRGTTSARSRARPPRPARHRVPGRMTATARRGCVAGERIGVSAGDGCCVAPPPARAAAGRGRRGRGPRRSPPGSG